ncbi:MULTISPECIES: glycosyltransferase family 39 protein [unclassified Polaromonas]|uniref:ArnT family glycosyltransferase n=1 Tax=unclassified Polaromonas TaxID=2638319 RepID=UPI0018C8D895|nr:MULTISPECIES: glycosyl transferase [unclassified Polaromonas]MBG6072271.1 4-amino-4-deoxy-L-arabinose transferase-like glycosyltransferase [Polaromonas sp. CG_9.7]MBG6114298.1 4-amino-4-deoxy-L-arabinose transferase-like glycosyltransferase [Polaromonas sp. CG_9.2]
MTSPDTTQAPAERPGFPVHRVWIGLALLVALAYLFGLGGDHIPRNGDELVYANIARLTAASGHWLPLQSAWDFMRNTKPPLLFWQAMVAGGWGDNWTLLNLRLPSIAYTWGITLMVALLTWKTVRNAQNVPDANAASTAVTAVQRSRHALTMGAIAALVYLSLFTTYRYGRPYLTSAPETFWLFGVFFALAWSPASLLASSWKFPLIAGIAVGIGCLYKSFVMVVPVGFGLALCYQAVGARVMPWHIFRAGIVSDGVKVAVICTLGLGIFGLWFALDPLPGEVWREFVVGENAGKMNASKGYFKSAFGGGGILVILTGYFSNALFLLPLSIGCFVAAWRSYRQRRGTAQTISDAEKIMWLWLLALALVFMLPTQRSTRYLIPAMPALAVVMALYWHRIGRIWFSLTLAVCMIGLLAMGLIGYGAVQATQDPWIYSPLFWVFVSGATLACLAGIFKKAWSRPLVALSAFSVLFALAWVTNPFNGELGRFKPETNARLQGQAVQVPSNFNGNFERYEFIIPGAKIVEYFAAQPVDYADVEGLFKNSRYVLVQRRIGQKPCTACRIIDERWDLRSRQDENDGFMAALKTPETYWYAKEYLVEPLP